MGKTTSARSVLPEALYLNWDVDADRALLLSGQQALLESVYYCFPLCPWFRNVSRSLRKEPKIYLWDWSSAPDEGSRNENFVASHLLKAVHAWTDVGLGEYALPKESMRFSISVRSRSRREICWGNWCECVPSVPKGHATEGNMIRDPEADGDADGKPMDNKGGSASPQPARPHPSAM